MQKLTRRKFVQTGSAAAIGMVIGCRVKNKFDILIKNGSVLDGTGSEGRNIAVGIKGDRIVLLDAATAASADQVIDATGLVVCPGFIDIHTHTDVQLLVNPLAESKIRQGVTTEVSGNCGDSPFPLSPDDQKLLDQEMVEKYDLHITWNDLDGFFQALEQKQIACNYATFTGHGSLRAAVVGKNDVLPTAEQLHTMRQVLARSIEQGSLGLSTGLEYAPGSYARTEELIELAKVVASHQGVYATHIRNEDDRLESAIEEALQVCAQAGVSVQISHLKACNQANWPKIDAVLLRIQQAIDAGLPVRADRYPYIAYGTGLGSFLPLWARQGSTEEILARLLDPGLAPKIAAYAESRGQRIGGWDRVVISSCFSEENRQWEGQSIQQCAKITGKTAFEFIRGLLIAEKNRVGIVGFAMSEENLHKVLSAPFVMIGSDGSAVAPVGKLGQGKPHPRYYGTFPRVLGRYCRQEQLFDLATAVHKMTGMPAEKLGLRQRGLLKSGYYADIVIFNPKTVIDNATFVEPHQFASGIEYVLVNGQIEVKAGTQTGSRAGRVLRHSA